MSMVSESPGELFQPTHARSHTPAPDLKILMYFIRGVLRSKIQCTSRGRIAECLDAFVTGQLELMLLKCGVGEDSFFFFFFFNFILFLNFT